MDHQIDIKSRDPIYKQLVSQIEREVREGRLSPGEALPSMSDLAARLGISKETVKKAYGVLTDKEMIIPQQGKGFFVADLSKTLRPRVLLLFDKISDYKQILFNAFTRRLGEEAEITILVHNQSLSQLEIFLDSYLDQYDFYVLTPHVPLDRKSQARAVRQMARIPNRKLILLDHLQPGYQGNYGAVYQDFENDIYDGLLQGLDDLRKVRNLQVVTMPQSLYGSLVRKGVKRFTDEFGIPVRFMTAIPEKIHPGETYLLLNSQLDAGIVELSRKIRRAGLAIGEDVKIISYNEIDMNEVILDGLTTVSTDFREMGRLSAEMILSRKMTKIHCPFRMNRRHTF
jgi:DNA-binding transcriptional regulator YhcF (GntR family)